MVIGALAWSLCYSLLLFVPLCALLGPEDASPARADGCAALVPMTPMGAAAAGWEAPDAAEVDRPSVGA